MAVASPELDMRAPGTQVVEAHLDTVVLMHWLGDLDTRASHQVRVDREEMAVVMVSEGEIAVTDGDPIAAGQFVILSEQGSHRIVARRSCSLLVAIVTPSTLRMTPSTARQAHLARGPGKGAMAVLVGATVTELTAALREGREVDIPGLASVLHPCLVAVVHSAALTHQVSHRAEQFQRAMHYIHGELSDPQLSPGRVAGHLGTSLRYLQVLFADHGESVAAYIRRMRLDQCRREVVARDAPIATIAGLYGFADASHFSRLFREQFGCTPRQERKRAVQLRVPS